MDTERSRPAWEVVFVAPAEGEHPYQDGTFLKLWRNDDLVIEGRSRMSGVAQYVARVEADSHEAAIKTVESVLANVDGETGVLQVTGPFEPE